MFSPEDFEHFSQEENHRIFQIFSIMPYSALQCP
jgi:hypothetical protein